MIKREVFTFKDLVFFKFSIDLSWLDFESNIPLQEFVLPLDE